MEVYWAVLNPWFVASKLLAGPDAGVADGPAEKLNGTVLLYTGVAESTSVAANELGSRDHG